MEALAGTKDPRALEPMKRLLVDSHPAVRGEAAGAMSQIGRN